MWSIVGAGFAGTYMPGLQILNERLVKRGNEQELAIKHRLKRFETEMEFKEKFDYHFINENLNKTIDKVEKLIKRKLK